jgi:hypothetical protein
MYRYVYDLHTKFRMCSSNGSSVTAIKPITQYGLCADSFLFFYILQRRSSGKNQWPTFLWHDAERIENSPIFAFIFVAAVTFLPNRCLATIDGFTCRHTDWWEGFIKYAVQMDSDAMICMQNFIKTSSGIQKFMGGDTQTPRQHDIISMLLFFQNKGSGLKILPEQSCIPPQDLLSYLIFLPHIKWRSYLTNSRVRHVDITDCRKLKITTLLWTRKV